MADEFDTFLDKLDFYIATGTRFGPQHRDGAREKVRASFDAAVTASVERAYRQNGKLRETILGDAARISEDSGGGGPVQIVESRPRTEGGPAIITEHVVTDYSPPPGHIANAIRPDVPGEAEGGREGGGQNV